MTTATILEPREKSDVTLNFTAGLVLALPFNAIIENIENIQNIKIKVNCRHKRKNCKSIDTL